MTSQRLDQALVTRGLVRSRTKAKRLIQGGFVVVDSGVEDSPARQVTDQASIELLDTDTDVGRGAVKLRAALDAWPIPVEGATAADLGASTGGFTQVLLERGATKVIAIDVGHDQLDSSLRDNPAVTVFEGVNVVALSPEWWAHEDLPACEVVVVDLSFISLTKVLDSLLQTFGPDAHYVFLVKPQFEVGKGGLDGGVVKSPAKQRAALDTVVSACRARELPVRAVMESPVTGEKGNVEYLAYASQNARVHPAEWQGTVSGSEG